MKNKYLEVFETLDNLLINFPSSRVNFGFLKIIVSSQLKSLKYSDSEIFIPEKLSRQKIYGKYIGKEESDVDSGLAKDKVNIKNLQNDLSDFIYDQPDCLREFRKIGYMPIIEKSESKTGSKNKVYLSLNIVEFAERNPSLNDTKMDSDFIASEINSEDQAIFIEDLENIKIDIYQIKYERTDPEKIKPSLITRIIFKNNELKMRSIKGIAIMLFFMSGVVLEFFLLAFAFIVFLLIRDLKTLTLWELILYCGFIPMAYLSWVGLFRPLHHLLSHRIIKAPEIFINGNADNADIEMYKGSDGYKVARVTEFTAICPICSAPIELATGKPDQKAPIVGRCREAPHAHVYSFDRITLKGFFLGHKGYLKESNSKNQI